MGSDGGSLKTIPELAQPRGRVHARRVASRAAPLKRKVEVAAFDGEADDVGMEESDCLLEQLLARLVTVQHGDGGGHAGDDMRLVATPRQLAADLAHHIYAGVGHIEQLSAVAAIGEVLDRGREPDPVAIGDWSAVDKDPVLRAQHRRAEVPPGGNPDLVGTTRETVRIDDGVANAVAAA